MVSRHALRATICLPISEVSSEVLLQPNQSRTLSQIRMSHPPPSFACVTPGTAHLYPFLHEDPYWQCLLLTTAMAFYYGGSSYIFLCPNFGHGQLAPPGQMCPSVIRNHFRGNEALLSKYLTYTVVHEMVHFYLGLPHLVDLQSLQRHIPSMIALH